MLSFSYTWNHFPHLSGTWCSELKLPELLSFLAPKTRYNPNSNSYHPTLNIYYTKCLYPRNKTYYALVIVTLSTRAYLPIWGFITYVTKWRRKPTVDFIHCQLFLGGFIDCLKKKLFYLCNLIFKKTFASSFVLLQKGPFWVVQSETPQQASRLTLTDLTKLNSIFPGMTWWLGDGVYLPTSRVSAEIAKRRGKPSVDFVKSQLLLGGFSYGLERNKLMSITLFWVSRWNSMKLELFAFSKKVWNWIRIIEGAHPIEKDTLQFRL